MKNLDIIKIENKYAIVSLDVNDIVKGDKVLFLKTNKIIKAEENYGTVGYTGHMGYSFLYFRTGVHCKFIKYITKKDINKIIGV